MNLPVVYGVTHDAETGELTARVPRATKIAIGKTKASGLHVFVQPNKERKLCVVIEVGRTDPKAPEYFAFDLSEPNAIVECKKKYAALLNDQSVVKRRAPEKLSYFTFLKEDGSGNYIHDIDAIVKHGSKPREIDVLITDDSPMHAGYEYWESRGLKCMGDGINARRSVEFSKGNEQLAADAKSLGHKFFPLSQCATNGCPYIKPGKNTKGYDVKQCGLSGSLSVQLVNDIRLGAKAEFTTTSLRSVRQLSASLIELATFTGGGDPGRGSVRGVALVLALTQFKTNHNNVPGTAYAVRLEFRAESIAAIRDKVLDAAKNFGMLTGAAAPVAQIEQKPVAQIAAPAEVEQPAQPEAAAVVVDAEYVEEAAEDAVEGAFRDAAFNDDGGEEIEDAQPDQESFDAAKADLMMQAEAGTNLPLPDIGKTGGLFGPTENVTAPYQDPGEQQPAPAKRGKVNFK